MPRAAFQRAACATGSRPCGPPQDLPRTKPIAIEIVLKIIQNPAPFQDRDSIGNPALRVSRVPPWCLPGCANGSFLPPWCLLGASQAVQLILSCFLGASQTVHSSFLPPWCLVGCPSDPFLPPWCFASCPISPFLPPWCFASCPMSPFLPPWCRLGCPNGPFLPPWCLPVKSNPVLRAAF